MAENKTLNEDITEEQQDEAIEVFIKQPYNSIKNNIWFYVILMGVMGGMVVAGYSNGFHNGRLWQCQNLSHDRILNTISQEWECLPIEDIRSQILATNTRKELKFDDKIQKRLRFKIPPLTPENLTEYRLNLKYEE